MATCTYLAFGCSDHRIQFAMMNYLSNGNMLGDADLIYFPGSIKDFVSGTEEERGVLRAKTQLLIGIHECTKLVCVGHEDCGAYGGDDEKMFDELCLSPQILFDLFPKIQEVILAVNKKIDGRWSVETIKSLSR